MCLLQEGRLPIYVQGSVNGIELKLRYQIRHRRMEVPALLGDDSSSYLKNNRDIVQLKSTKALERDCVETLLSARLGMEMPRRASVRKDTKISFEASCAGRSNELKDGSRVPASEILAIQ